MVLSRQDRKVLINNLFRSDEVKNPYTDYFDHIFTIDSEFSLEIFSMYGAEGLKNRDIEMHKQGIHRDKRDAIDAIEIMYKILEQSY